MIKKFFVAGTVLWLASFVYTGVLLAQEQNPVAKIPYTPKIISMEGEVSVNLAGEKWEQAQKQMALSENAVIKSGGEAYCDIAFDSAYKNIVSVGPNSEVKIGEQFQKVRIARGRVFAQLKNLEPGSKFEVATPQAVAGVRGTAWETIAGTTSQFNVLKNTVYVEGFDASGNATGEMDVGEGFSIGVDMSGVLGQITELSPDDKGRMENWLNRVDNFSDSAFRKKCCLDIVNSSQGASGNLFTQVMQCEAEIDQEAFAAASPGGTGTISGNESPGGSDQGVPGGDVTNTSFGRPPETGGSKTGGNDNPPPPPPPPPPPEERRQGCFLAGTIITMADGSAKPIETIKVGDVVLAFDQESGQMKPDAVKKVFYHPKESNYLIINGNLKVTPNHPVLSKGQWRPVGELKAGDVLTDTKGQEVAIASIAQINEQVDVYNFEVNPYSTYVANGFIVHNKKIQQEVSEGP